MTAPHPDIPLKLDLDRYLPALITFLANKLSSGASNCYRNHFGVGIVEWRMLALLAVEDGITANRVCQVIGLDKAAVSRAVKQLESQQLITAIPDPADCRRTHLRLTAAGCDMHNRIIKVALARESQLLADLSDDEVDQLVSLLLRISARVEDANRCLPEAE
ncbi:MarR family winged helix-turn-helix transcriptional regulator [Parathalassolituus penaei]|uniref:MarR family winged helix-turn-helix transcriptional regulator n=1 Tax=Parathalassolituus penaei TaxID=2997323 RepID=A0A9X3EP61_9GAMM|nr:MarR family winged helix-turn-helix transcriptional regulator [Parathalassolituus penaei]MCY0966283.1 MarR family winged helix-turn-helix transcriptional regulator [Parathalassolituus penaei]